MKSEREVIEVNLREWEALLKRARQEPLDEASYQKLQAALRAFRVLTEMIGEKNTTISRLRALLAKPGDRCPECQKGKVYEQKEPALRIRVVGQAPIAATVYELERLRCNLCGEIFEAAAPASVGEKKYDETTAAMIALLKYGSGVPFYRLEGLEASLGIPLPASSQWEIAEGIADVIQPAFDELIRQAVKDEVFYNDDPGMKILALARASPRRAEEEQASSRSKERTGAVHQRHRVHARGAAHRALLHRAQACRGELRPGVRRAGQGTGAAHSNFGCSVTQRVEARGEAGNSLGKLQRARPASLCRGDADLSPGVPIRAGKLARRLPL
jgi:hypothetical protein